MPNSVDNPGRVHHLLKLMGYIHPDIWYIVLQGSPGSSLLLSVSWYSFTAE